MKLFSFRSNVMPLLSLFVMLATVLAPINNAHANAADLRISLVSSPDVRAKGTAKYRDRSGEREFQVEAELARRFAGTELVVVVNDIAVGTMKVNNFGLARLSLNSRLGQPVPLVKPGSIVKVATNNGATILAGHF